jgi:hypothetical protein
MELFSAKYDDGAMAEWTTPKYLELDTFRIKVSAV